MKALNKKGFTLAELLIVMAIVVVLAAIAIPTFGKQLETARETADVEAIRAAFEDAFTMAQTDYANAGKFVHATDGSVDADQDATYTITGIKVTQQTAGFQYVIPKLKVGKNAAVEATNYNVAPAVASTCSVSFVFARDQGATTGAQEGAIKLVSFTIS